MAQMPRPVRPAASARDAEIAASPGRRLRGRNLLRAIILFGAIAAATACAGAQPAEPIFPRQTWDVGDPAAAGWNVERLRAAYDFYSGLGSTALVIIHDGQVVAGWGDVNRPIKVHSVRKSFMSALYGVAVAQRKVDLRWTLGSLRIDDYPPSLTPTEKQATVRDLLMARSGVYHDAAAETRSMKQRRPQRGSHLPGTFWYYNNWDFNVLGTILRNVTGEDTFAAIERYIARPIGMQSFTARNGDYVRIRGSAHPAYHLYFSALDMARFGWLFLNQGRWGDRQVIPSAWVRESTTPWTKNARRGVAYGYMWWTSMNEVHFGARMGPGAFSARGNGGQFIVVAPARGIVVVHLNNQEENDKLERGTFNELMKLVFAAAP